MDENLIAAMQAEFWRIKAEHDAIMAQSQVIKDEAAVYHRQIEELYELEIATRAAQIREIEAPVLDLAKQMSRLVRALDGKTGERPEA